MKQYDIILKAMLTNKDKKEWKATDFQKEPYFVGYEASPRMSELAKMYPDLIIAGKDGRFRTLSINWDYEHIQEYIGKYMYNDYEGICIGTLKGGLWQGKHFDNIDTI